MGCDFTAGKVFAAVVRVSIHAPAWGATQRPLPASPPGSTFQSTHPRGVRLSAGTTLHFTDQFQSTHPRGVRRSHGQCSAPHRTSFNPRTRVGCDGKPICNARAKKAFQSTHPRGVRQNCRRRQKNYKKVSIHAPAWGATHPTFPSLRPRPRFNPRTRVGCDQKWWPFGRYLVEFQSTHPRGVRLQQVQHIPAKRLVSIHAPAWGATQQRVLFDLAADVSIHAPAWGATISREQVTEYLGVSIHAPAWGATRRRIWTCRLILVSIHAPAWGATHSQNGSKRFLTCFNPRTRVGCDHHRWLGPVLRLRFNPRTRVGCDLKRRGKKLKISMFQSTHPRGVRRQATLRGGYCWCFNPRTRVGCDAWAKKRPLPSWRFQSTHPRGVRPGESALRGQGSGFNPRTRVGCDGQIDHAWAINDGFQSTHPRGVRHVFQPGWRDNLGVSIHAPAWGATSARDTFFSARLFQSTHPRGVRPFSFSNFRQGEEFQSTHPRGVRRWTHSSHPDHQ